MRLTQKLSLCGADAGRQRTLLHEPHPGSDPNVARTRYDRPHEHAPPRSRKQAPLRRQRRPHGTHRTRHPRADRLGPLPRRPNTRGARGPQRPRSAPAAALTKKSRPAKKRASPDGPKGARRSTPAYEHDPRRTRSTGQGRRPAGARAPNLARQADERDPSWPCAWEISARQGRGKVEKWGGPAGVVPPGCPERPKSSADRGLGRTLG